MAGLPENWEWDYDGKRWFYRYKPTGLIQFTFPKPGDEFPEFVDDTSEPPDLPPEEKLVSQQQVKRRSTLGESQSKQTSTAARRDRAPSNAVSDIDDGGGPFWLQPDGLMYMGPGAYNDISPLQEEEEERGLGDGGGEVLDAPTPSTVATNMVVTAAAATTGVAPNESPVPPARSQISPVASVKTTPLVIDSLPATTTPELDSGGVVIGANEHAPADAVGEPPEIPLLDSRQIPYNPIGFMAELPSEFTAQCDEEINPAPVEMPSNEVMIDTSEPAPYANAFHFAPVELPLNEARIARNPLGDVAEEKSIATQVPLREKQEQQQRAHQAVRELLNRPYKPVRQSSLPQSVSALDQPSNPAASGPTPGKYQAYNPAKHALHGVAAANRSSTVEPRDRQPLPVDDNKRHTFAGPPPPQFRMSEVTPALQPADVRPLDSPDSVAQTTVPRSSRPRPESISGPITQANSGGLAHFPSVLQPARGRPVLRNQTPPQSQGASPARSYQAYRPYRDLQRDIEDTVQLLSKSGYGQGATAAPEASDPMRPRISRTSTLPTHLPALPFMGVRPHLPHSVTSEGLQSSQAPSSESTGVPSGREAGIVPTQPYPGPLPPSGSDIPQPLNLSRKSPPPQNSAPTFASTIESSITAKPGPIPGAVPGKTTPAPSGTTIASAPVASSIVEPDPGRGNSSARDNTSAHGEQSGVMAQPDPVPASDRPHQSSPERTTVTTTSNAGQAIASGFSVMVESTMLPAPRDLASVPPAAVKSETSTNQPVPATSSPQGAVNAPTEMANTQDSSALSESARVPGPGTSSQTSLGDPRTVEQPRLQKSEVVGQETTQTSFQPSLVAPDAQHSSYAIPQYQTVGQVHHQPPSQPAVTLPTDSVVQTQGAYFPVTSATPPSSSVNEASNPAHGQVVAAQPPSVTPKPPSPRTPSPVSRASSPPTRADPTNGFPSLTSPVPTLNNLAQNTAVATQTPPGQVGFRPPVVGSGAMATTSSPAPPVSMPVASSAAPVYSLPSGHHPLASHPVSSPQPSSPGPGPSASAQTASVISSQSAPMAHSNAGVSGSGGTSNQQQSGAVPVTMPSQPPAQTPPSQRPPMPVSPSSVNQQTAVSSATSTPSQGHKASQSIVPQVAPVVGNSQLPIQPGGQMPPMQFSQGPAANPTGSHQAHQNMPLRTFSHATVPQPGPPNRPPGPGTAPPQMPMMFAPPGMAPGMQPQGFQPGMPPPQQHYYGFQPGMQHQQQQQQQPQYFMAPHMMQPSQMPGGSYVMQPQAAQPVKEEKGWFGRLWRGDTVKKANTPNPANRLQKGPPHQGPPVFPPQPHPNQQQQQQQQFHPGGPHMMMMPGHPAQQSHLQQAPTMQHQQQQQQQPQQHQQQQQQQQPLMWKPNASGGQNPQFPSVKHNNNPNQPTIPPPEVLQAIKQQEQRLPQGQGQVAQGGAGANGAGKTSGTAPALAASSAGYDGSGWGDDDGEFK